MNISVSIDKIFDHLRKISPIIISISIVSGAMLFAPYSIREKLYLTNLSPKWMRIISVTFLFTAFLTLTLLIETMVQSVKKKVKVKTNIKKRKEQYLTLNNYQKAIVLETLQSRNGYVRLGLTDGNAQYLIQLGFIFRPNQGVQFDFDRNEPVVNYIPQPWLVMEYNKNPDFFIRNGE